MKVITDHAILEADDDGELVLAALYPTATEADVRSRVGWQLRSRREVLSIERPTAQELDLLRNVVDRDRRFLA